MQATDGDVYVALSDAVNSATDDTAIKRTLQQKHGGHRLSTAIVLLPQTKQQRRVEEDLQESKLKVELDPELRKSIMAFGKQSTNHIRLLFDLLLSKLKTTDSSITRLLALLLIHGLFLRSKLFRTLTVDSINEIHPLILGSQMSNPEAGRNVSHVRRNVVDVGKFERALARQQLKRMGLPGPYRVAELLQQKALMCIYDWYREFHTSLPLLKRVYLFLAHVRKFPFPDVEALEQERKTTNERMYHKQQKLLRIKFENMFKTFPEMMGAVSSSSSSYGDAGDVGGDGVVFQLVVETENALELLVSMSSVYHDANNSSSSSSSSSWGANAVNKRVQEEKEKVAEAIDDFSSSDDDDENGSATTTTLIDCNLHLEMVTWNPQQQPPEEEEEEEEDQDAWEEEWEYVVTNEPSSTQHQRQQQQQENSSTTAAARRSADLLAIQLKNLPECPSEEASLIRETLVANCKQFVEWRGMLMDWFHTMRKIDFQHQIATATSRKGEGLTAYAVKHKTNLNKLMLERLETCIADVNRVWKLCRALGIRVRVDPAIVALNAFQRKQFAVPSPIPSQPQQQQPSNVVVPRDLKRKRTKKQYTKMQKSKFKRRALMQRLKT